MDILGVEGLSTCTPCPSGPLLDRRVTEDLIPMLPILTMTEPSQCMKLAYVTDADKPVLSPVASGGTFPSSALGFSASLDLGFVRYGYVNQLSGDIADQIHAVAEVQARLAAVIMGDAFAADSFRDPPNALYAHNFPYFASQNPNGVTTPAAGVGTPPTRRDLLCLRRSIEPHGASARIVYVMNTAMLDALDRSTFQDGYPLDWRPDIDGAIRAHLSGVPVVLSDNIAAMEPGGGSSVYAMRLPDPSDSVGNDGVHLVVPPGESGVQVFSAPASETDDQVQFRVQMNRMLFVGPRTYVARMTNFGTQ